MGDLGDTVRNLPTEEIITTDKEDTSRAILWSHHSEQNSWQSETHSVNERTSRLYNNNDMADLDILACDENWWFGQTVKDYVGHRFLLASSSPVFHYLLYNKDDCDPNEDPEKPKKLILDSQLNVTLTLTKTYSGHRLEMDGIPPIAAEAMLEYIYKDKFNASDYEKGYSRNLLWRLWHASKAFEINHLNDLCSKTIDATMCEETVFWDLNYSIQYQNLGVGDLLEKVLKLMETLNERLYEHPNLVWLDKLALKEILLRRKPNNCEPMIIYNNLLRWSLYQVDRSACCEVDDKTNGDIPIEARLAWIEACRKGESGHVSNTDLEKYIARGTEFMPWQELSQTQFLQYVVPFGVLCEDKLLDISIRIMEQVVKNPDRLTKSEFRVQQDCSREEPVKTGRNFIESRSESSPRLAKRTNSLLSLTRRPEDITLQGKIPLTKLLEESEDINQKLSKPSSPA